MWCWRWSSGKSCHRPAWSPPPGRRGQQSCRTGGRHTGSLRPSRWCWCSRQTAGGCCTSSGCLARDLRTRAAVSTPHYHWSSPHKRQLDIWHQILHFKISFLCFSLLNFVQRMIFIFLNLIYCKFLIKISCWSLTAYFVEDLHTCNLAGKLWRGRLPPPVHPRPRHRRAGPESFSGIYQILQPSAGSLHSRHSSPCLRSSRDLTDRVQFGSRAEGNWEQFDL